MIFLIVYDRHKGLVISFETFDDGDQLKAEDLKIQTELDLHKQGIGHEVVLLQAENEQALRRTHRRYFESATQIGSPVHPIE